SADEIRGGMLATTPNMGYYRERKFVVIPMIDLGAGYRWNRHISTNVGYELIYLGDIWTAAGAVSDEIDGRNLPQGTSGATTVPGFSGKTKELWIQGLRAGLQVEF
ncbi:MAG: BBP7 family outer membrane beta-barrel protein, partial [Planctomycetia bacterium]|nr:BBP7 family outer membrane beta-barrel protein [Planctomycetia bacterium]